MTPLTRGRHQVEALLLAQTSTLTDREFVELQHSLGGWGGRLGKRPFLYISAFASPAGPSLRKFLLPVFFNPIHLEK